jgi:hypothetical protein
MSDLRFAIGNLRLVTRGAVSLRRARPSVQSQIANRKSQIRLYPFLAAVALWTTGCVGGRQLPPAERPTPADPKLATTAYWFDQRGTEVVTHDNFDQLWEAARRTANQ